MIELFNILTKVDFPTSPFQPQTKIENHIKRITERTLEIKMESIRFPTRDYFPLSEVPYSSNHHHKTPFSSCPEKEVILAIPNGKKSYLWLSNNGEDVCFSVPRNFKTHPEWTEVSIANLSTQSPKPFYGTLLSGTLVYLSHSSKHMEYFVADDLFYFAGISLTKSPFQERLQYLLTFFKQFLLSTPSSTPTNHKKLSLVLANMRGMNELETKPIYKIHHWQLRNLSFISPYYALSSSEPVSQLQQSPPPPPIETKPTITKPSWIFQYQFPTYKQKVVFKIIPEEQCDVYLIYARLPTTPTEWVSCGYAGIFDYHTSKLLNFHCRNIITNHLDQMEESDDEEEEEEHLSLSPNKPTTPNSFYFECTFSAKFRKWIPVSFIPSCSPEKVIHINALAIIKEQQTKGKLPYLENRKYK